MTTSTETNVDERTENSGDESKDWGNIVVSMAGYLAQYSAHRRGDLAELRRMDPSNPKVGVYWRLMAEKGLLNLSTVVENKWALILHGMAIMTPNDTNDLNFHTAHQGNVPVGKALYLGGAEYRSSAFYSETRLNTLLVSRGPVLYRQLVHLFRTMASEKVTFNWREMSRFILNEGYNKEGAERSRRNIARNYYRAMRASTISTDEPEE